MRPTLVVHEAFKNHIFMKKTNGDSFENRIRAAFDNVVGSDDLVKRDADIVIVGDNGSRSCELLLEPYYKSRGAGDADFVLSDSARTSAVVRADGKTPRTVDDRAPRFVIWYDDEDLRYAAPRYTGAATRPGYPKPLRPPFVGPLDGTRIATITFTTAARENYNYVVLWSHGDALHVDKFVSKIEFTFDLVLSADQNNGTGCKNLLHLYNYFNHTIRFLSAVLVDDSAYNWSDEYDAMIVPARCIKNIHQVAVAIEYAKRRLINNT